MLSKVINFLSDFSIPLIAGVILAFLFANNNYEAYLTLIHTPIFGSDFTIFGHPITFAFLMNDIFMVFFFGIATVEITQALSQGGSLNPISKAINPLFGTAGGILGPIAVFFILAMLWNVPVDVYNGWAIPTATDIALAWIIARLILGRRHPAVAFLLLLAIADDAIGLVIIAIAYPDPTHPVEVYWLGLTLLGILISYILHKRDVHNFWLYLIFGGTLSWLGLILAHLHPALALVFIVPFMPNDNAKHIREVHPYLFESEDDDHSTLSIFEHKFALFVVFGLLGFGLANAGVLVADITEVTWLILLSLIIGKAVGISLCSFLAVKLGFSLPKNMNLKSLYVTSLIAGLGLTVALFVSGVAYTDRNIQNAAKMGALLSIIVIPIVFVLAKVFRIEKMN